MPLSTKSQNYKDVPHSQLFWIFAFYFVLLFKFPEIESLSEAQLWPGPHRIVEAGRKLIQDLSQFCHWDCRYEPSLLLFLLL